MRELKAWQPGPHRRVWLGLLVLIVGSSCGNGLECAIKGDNVRGRVYFASTSATKRTRIRVQSSVDSFATIMDTGVTDNGAGLIAVPFGLCATNDVDFELRAFEDTDGDEAYTAGEPSGRDDGSDTGHSGYETRNVASSNSSDDWNVLRDIEIYLDETTAP